MKSLIIIASLAVAFSRADLCQEDYFEYSETSIWRTTEKTKQATDSRFTLVPLLSKAQVLKHKEI